MHRFFVAPATLRADRVTLTGSQARQIATVLRLREGDEIALVADGAEAVVALEVVRPTSVTAVVRERGFTPAEPTVALTLALPILRGDHDEEVVEAARSSGTRIIPFTRALRREDLSEAKRTGGSACTRGRETARRGRVPSSEQRGLDELFAFCPGRSSSRGRTSGVRACASAPQTARAVSLVVGPEGGIAMRRSRSRATRARSRYRSVLGICEVKRPLSPLLRW